MIKKAVFLFLTAGFMLSGCAVVAGLGAGAGVYTYIKGELKRMYPVPFEQALETSEDALAALKIKVAETSQQGLTTIISCRGNGDTPIMIKVIPHGPSVTEITVRSGLTGLWEKRTSELIHATIAQTLPQ